MESFGETDILENGAWLAGRLRVTGIRADHALAPRLRLTLGVQLQRAGHSRATGHPSRAPDAPEVAVELREVTGELHLATAGGPAGTDTDTYTGAYLARVWWTGAPRAIPALPHSHESSLEVACDLTPLSLERLETHRAGMPLRLTLTPWLGVWRDGHPVDTVTARAFDLTVPRERWLDVLAGFGAERSAVLEIRFSSREAVPFQAAAAQLREATALMDRGAYREAVAACRLAYEVMLRERPAWAADGGKGLWTALTPALQERTAPLYERLTSTLKQLTALTHHGYGAEVVFTRAEALLVLGLTAPHSRCSATRPGGWKRNERHPSGREPPSRTPES